MEGRDTGEAEHQGWPVQTSLKNDSHIDNWIVRYRRLNTLLLSYQRASPGYHQSPHCRRYRLIRLPLRHRAISLETYIFCEAQASSPHSAAIFCFESKGNCQGSLPRLRENKDRRSAWRDSRDVGEDKLAVEAWRKRAQARKEACQLAADVL